MAFKSVELPDYENKGYSPMKGTLMDPLLSN